MIEATTTLSFRQWIPILAAVLLVAAYFAYRRTTPPVSGRVRAGLTVLRAAAFLCLVLVLLDPRCVRTVDREESAKVLVLMDRSASMALPAGSWDDAASETRFDAARRSASALKLAVEKAGGTVETLYFASGLSPGPVDTIRADGQGTDVTQSIEDAYRRHEGEHLAAIAVFSDGAETEDRLVRRPLPGLPVFTVGFGDTVAPEDVRIKDVDYNSVVTVPSRSPIEATVTFTGMREKRVALRLTEGDRVVFERDTVMTPAVPEIAVRIPVEYREARRRQFVFSAEVGGHDAQPDNNRRDIVVEAEKAQAKIVIVDLQPGWELHFLTGLLRREASFDFVVLSLPGRPGAPLGRIRDPATFEAELSDCDAVVLLSVDENFFSASRVDALKRFLRDRGGGLLVMPGTSSVFEHPGVWDQLGDMLPVRGHAPFQWTLGYTSVLPGAQAAANPITSHMLPLLSQTDWQERAPLLGYYAALAPTSVGEVLISVKDRKLPAFTYQTLGKGRVAVVSAGPLWRWRFLSDNNAVYDELVSRTLEVLSRGDDSDLFVVTAKKNVFEAGEPAVVFAELLNDKMQPVTSAPVRLEVARVEENGQETPLDFIPMRRDAVQNTRFKAVIPPLSPGRYFVRGRADLPERTVESRVHEIRISSTSVEYRQMQQDRTALAGIALRTGGTYTDGERLAPILDRLKLEPRRTPSLSEMSLRTSLLLFLVMIGLLAAEWAIRKRAGMI